MTTDTIAAYTAQIPETDLEDLRARLGRVRWPDEVADAGWDYGVSVAYVRELAARWRQGFNWRRQEKRLNAYPQFLTTIDGEQIHFPHVRSPEADALPLIITHDWPMSVFEYLDLIGPLSETRAHGADPADAFHLVISSVPGTGFSGATGARGWDTARIARAWAALMARLGNQSYGAHGNDLGSQVSPEVGRRATEKVGGVHVTQLFSFPSGDPAEFADLTEEYQRALGFLQRFTSGGGLAYNQYQSAQPQTLAHSLQDSPVGWLAWVLKLFRDSGDPDPHRRIGLLADQHGRLLDPPLLRGRACHGARCRADDDTDGRRDLCPGFPVRPPVHRPRPREHCQLEPIRAGDSLRDTGRIRLTCLRHPRLLPQVPLGTLRVWHAATRG